MTNKNSSVQSWKKLQDMLLSHTKQIVKVKLSYVELDRREAKLSNMTCVACSLEGRGGAIKIPVQRQQLRGDGYHCSVQPSFSFSPCQHHLGKACSEICTVPCKSFGTHRAHSSRQLTLVSMYLHKCFCLMNQILFLTNEKLLLNVVREIVPAQYQRRVSIYLPKSPSMC